MKNKKTFLLLLLVPIIIFFIGRTFALPYTEEIRSVEIQSENYPNPGSWHIDKSAEWIGFGKARVTFDVNSIIRKSDDQYKDIILVIDISGSMQGEKIERAKQDAINLIEYLLLDSNNRVALITFDTTSTIVSDFTNDREVLLNLLNNIIVAGTTNYNDALLNVDEVLNDYTKKDNTDLVTLFLTDGYPNEYTPNEVSVYNMLKDKYPYMTINGIQYEMGREIIQEIIDITDNQWIADVDTLHNVLFEASVSPITYNYFEIVDYINNDSFYINSVDDIVVPFGEVTIEAENNIQKIIWNLGNNYKTGDKIKMYFDLELKTDYNNVDALYPTNKSETIKYQLRDEEETTINSLLTPILKNNYYVIYDTNTPNGCSLPEYEPEKYYVYQNVSIKDEKLFCRGYIFKGWQMNYEDKKDINIINEDVFIMPSHDVHINAIWAKQDLVKKMDGSVREKLTLYSVLENAYNEGIYAKKYNGNHQDSYNATGNKNIYYFYSSNDANAKEIKENKMNVIFANHCWQMLRTTDTGGVKLIYNGEPENGMCLDDRNNHEGYNGRNLQSLQGKYYYGTSYVYENNSFKIAGTKEQVEVTSNPNTNAATVIPTLKGKYTCKKTNSTDTCSTIYLVDDYDSATNAYLFSINKNSHFSQYGNVPYNQSSKAVSYSGYMYNDAYEQMSQSQSYGIYNYYKLITPDYYYSEAIYYDDVSNTYELINPQLVSSLDDYNNLVGKFIMPDGTTTPNSIVYHILKTDGLKMFYKMLSNGDLNTSIVIGDTYQDNGNGTYTVKNTDGTQALLVTYSDWYNTPDYSIYSKKYVCAGTSATCNNIMHIRSDSPTSNGFGYWGVKQSYKFSETVKYENGGYTLTGDIITVWDLIDNNELSKLNTHHYSCLSTETTCTEVNFINFYASVGILYYIHLNDVNNINEAIVNMTSVYDENKKVNTKDSVIKKAVDAWYKEYIYDMFDSYIEDTIYCNDRTISNYGALQENGIINRTFQFINKNENDYLKCSNETDRFSTLNDKAKLKYKVGLITKEEKQLSYNNNMLKTGNKYWTNAANGFTNIANIGNIIENGSNNSTSVSNSAGVRPVISLIPGIEILDGDGSQEHPYKVDDGTN